MDVVTSLDGTRIAYRRSGSGPPLVLVHGSTADHTRWAGILPDLERNFTVLAMDRRGRGGSGDAVAYALEREYEDVAAVVRAAGRDVSLIGHSFGALCAMEAALRVDDLKRLVLYEPVFPVGGRPLYPPDLPARLKAILETGDRDAMLVAFFKEAAGTPDAQIEALRKDPSWTGRIAAAHTALRELADGDYVFIPERFRGLLVETLLLVGEISPAELTAPSQALENALPHSRIVILEGQGHVAMTTAPKLFLDTVLDFLGS
ncbi:alpha/beta fold hydrolase [Pelagibacterium xiamenense]|uniref:alpha/beta fold hydrolase n=1 Tax=Pelagibacterium xiamenense TaxID=2901140 RepID=UPI001E577115|nr:alpha/beta hydrolase [Pelagibacterium xiamenense]MCD7059950.1 alpha/beta hydrolase [Pelagibacterium xiamenense]